MRQETFVREFMPLAREAGKVYKMNPEMILAQAALESGWGTSFLCLKHNNLFGMMGYGAANGHWHGKKAELRGPNYTRSFRHYETPQLSFLDFARLISSAYPRAWAMSYNPEAYAKEIAYSPYISELNGDDREVYRRSLVSLQITIARIKALLK